MKYSILILFAISILEAIAAVPPHKHEKHSSGSKERIKDGIYQGRDAKHYEDGAHHSEFDHEAIIGLCSLFI